MQPGSAGWCRYFRVGGGEEPDLGIQERELFFQRVVVLSDLGGAASWNRLAAPDLARLCQAGGSEELALAARLRLTAAARDPSFQVVAA